MYFIFSFYSDRQRWDLNGQQQNQIMNDADLMSSAYATYAQNIATLGAIENHSLIDQLQSLLKSNGVQAHSSGALQRKLSTEQVSEPLTFIRTFKFWNVFIYHAYSFVHLDCLKVLYFYQ